MRSHRRVVVVVAGAWLLINAGCGGAQVADAGSSPDAMVPRCGPDGAACTTAARAGLCRSDTCSRCVDVTEDSACQAAWGAATRCLSGVCQDGCRVDADCSSGLRCTDAHLCVSVTCTALAPEFGTVNGGTSPVVVGPGLSPSWACNAGFALSGTVPSCTTAGTFSGPAPTCAPVTCSVSAPMNGTLNGGTSPITLAYDATATWACDVGFQLTGTAPKCGGTGALTGPAPTCAPITCNATAPANGTLNGGTSAITLAYDATATWACDVGFALTGTAPKCGSTGALTGPAPTCAPITCVATAPANGTVNGGAGPVMLAYDATATWACGSGFLLTGPAPRCGATGALTGPVPTCDAITCIATAPANGTVNGGTTPITLNFNATATWACDTAYSLTGTAPTCSGPNLFSGPAPTCQAAACNDSIDADGDGFGGFPEDPGCSALADDDETDDCPSGPMCPACSNGLDDDGDGFTDFGVDPGCLSASGATETAVCTSVDPVVLYAAGPSRTFAGAANDVDLSCGADGRDQVYRLVVRLPLVSLVVDTGGSVTPAAVALRRNTCASTDLACGVANLGADGRVTLTNVAVGEYFVLVDDLGATSTGSFSLNVRGEYALGARCDSAFACATGSTCLGPTSSAVCTQTACSDNVDSDGDGANGFPTDPGCSSPQDNDEADDCPSGPMCPLCSNGVDDDGDNQTDYPSDSTCPSAGGTTEGP